MTVKHRKQTAEQGVIISPNFSLVSLLCHIFVTMSSIFKPINCLLLAALLLALYYVSNGVVDNVGSVGVVVGGDEKVSVGATDVADGDLFCECVSCPEDELCGGLWFGDATQPKATTLPGKVVSSPCLRLYLLCHIHVSISHLICSYISLLSLIPHMRVHFTSLSLCVCLSVSVSFKHTCV